MITDVNCDLSPQLTGQLVNLSTCQLQIMITDVNRGLSLQLTRQLVNLSTRQLVNYKLWLPMLTMVYRYNQLVYS